LSRTCGRHEKSKSPERFRVGGWSLKGFPVLIVAFIYFQGWARSEELSKKSNNLISVQNNVSSLQGTYGAWGRNCVKGCNDWSLVGAIVEARGSCVCLYWSSWASGVSYEFWGAGTTTDHTLEIYSDDIDDNTGKALTCRTFFNVDGNRILVDSKKIAQ
jgi:hypothetical protein